MRKPLLTALLGAILACPAAAMAADPGADINGALTDNPARLGHSPVFTLMLGATTELPGLPSIQEAYNNWFDAETNRLNIVLDVTTQEKAEETAARLDKLFESVSGTEARVVTGMSLGRLGFGGTVSAGVKAESTTTPTVDPDNYEVVLDGRAEAVARADANVTLGIPIGKALAVGVTGKYAYIQSAVVTGNATFSQSQGGSPTSATTESRDSGEGYLFDAGVTVKLGKLRAEAALHDVGSLKWKAETATSVREHASPTHLAGGLTLQPVKALTVGGYLDNTVFGDPQGRVFMEIKPLPFIAFTGTYRFTTPNTPAYYTLGAGIKLLGIGLDASASVHDNLISGAGATVSIRF